MACKLSLLISGLILSPGPLHFKQNSPFFCPFPPKKAGKKKNGNRDPCIEAALCRANHFT